MMCGTDPYPKDYKAKKYKLEKHSLRKEDFVHLMKNLPVHVDEGEIEEMFAYADRNEDGHLSYSEFQVMVNPPPAPKVPKPHIADIGLPPQVCHFLLLPIANSNSKFDFLLLLDSIALSPFTTLRRAGSSTFCSRRCSPLPPLP